jgi:subtilase family serine protease
VVLKPRDEAAVKAFISQVTDKHSAAYGHYLAPGAYATQFGPTPATISAIKTALQAQGLTVTSVATDGLLVNFSGSASHVEATFRTGLDRYQLADGSAGQATTSAVQLPSAIAGSVSSVVGLNELVHAHPANIRHGSSTAGHPAAKSATFPHPAGSPTACADASGAAQAFGGLTDDQIANAYGAFGLYNSGDFGTGQHIAVYELEPFLPSDLQTFDTCYYGATQAAAMAGRVSVIPVDGGQTAGPGSGEATLDVEDVSGIAPGANLDVYEAPNTTFGTIDACAPTAAPRPGATPSTSSIAGSPPRPGSPLAACLRPTSRCSATPRSRSAHRPTSPARPPAIRTAHPSARAKVPPTTFVRRKWW